MWNYIKDPNGHYSLTQTENTYLFINYVCPKLIGTQLYHYNEEHLLMLKINSIKEKDMSSVSQDNKTAIFCSYLFKISGSYRDTRLLNEHLGCRLIFFL